MIQGVDAISVEARVWDVKHQTLVYTSPPPSPMRQLDTFFSADGERLVTDVREGQMKVNRNASGLTAIRVVGVSDGKELTRMSVDRQIDTTWVSALGVSPDLAKRPATLGRGPWRGRHTSRGVFRAGRGAIGR
jgi:hypothetical protein